MSTNCPVCNKSGLPDYTKDSVVCPQCNSDLKPFLLLHSISKSSKSKFSNYAIIGISLLSILLLGLYLKTNSAKDVLIAQKMALTDSIYKIDNVIVNNPKKKNQKPQISEEKKVIAINYTVKKGDYPYKIAKFFYGDGSLYKRIERDNNLIQPYILKVGQILTIKIIQ